MNNNRCQRVAEQTIEEPMNMLRLNAGLLDEQLDPAYTSPNFPPMTQKQMVEAWKVTRTDVSKACASAPIRGHVDPDNLRSQALFDPAPVLEELVRIMNERVTLAWEKLQYVLMKKMYLQYAAQEYAQKMKEGAHDDKAAL